MLTLCQVIHADVEGRAAGHTASDFLTEEEVRMTAQSLGAFDRVMVGESYQVHAFLLERLVDLFRVAVGLPAETTEKGDVTVPKVPLGEPLAIQCAHFLECIVSGKQPFTGAPEGIAVVRALEAMQRSIRARGREERVEPSC